MAEAKVLFLKEYCTRTFGSTCARCVAACPAHAIQFDENNVANIQADACTQCAICCSVCDAFSSTRVTMLDLHERIKNIALTGQRVVITCKENIFEGLEPSKNVVVLPCLAVISPEMWTLMLTENIDVVVGADLHYCLDCTRAGNAAVPLYSYAIEHGQIWAAKDVKFVKTIPEKPTLKRALGDESDVERRAAFGGLITDAVDIATGRRHVKNSQTLANIQEQRERLRATARIHVNEELQASLREQNGEQRRILFPKREMLVEAIRNKPTIAWRIPVNISYTEMADCDDCGKCCINCPTGARIIDKEKQCLAFDSLYCIGCGVCVNACPKGLVGIKATRADCFNIKSRSDEAEGEGANAGTSAGAGAGNASSTGSANKAAKPKA